ncbi:MAG: ribosome maturation factor RimM [Vicinamibacterales bacterium]
MADEAILVGVVARSHGNRGEVILNSETDFPEERFRAGARLDAIRKDGRAIPLEVAAMRMHLGRPVVRFVGYESIGDAEGLAGLELTVAASQATVLPRGEYYHRDLIGCEVVTTEGAVIGRVTDVEGERQANRLVVKGRRGEVLIPLADEICRVDLGTRRITVTPPEGLLELNGEWR